MKGDTVVTAVRRCAVIALAAVLAACVSAPGRPPLPPPAPAPAPPGTVGIYKVGTPYQIAGIWYYPQVDESYDATGIASWYGAGFHGQVTANGEVFDRNALTAAHPTLPMPVNVRVTNLQNGRSIVVRVNDRGPYVNGRIIDLSERAADLLGFRDEGTARVRVTYLARANLKGIGPVSPAESTPPEIAGAVPAAPTKKIAQTALPPVPGVRVAPQPTIQSKPLPAPAAAMTGSGPVPDGEVTIVPVPPVTAIYVQAGAYASFDNAKRVVARLKGMDARLTQTVKEGRPLYRVRIGPFQDVHQADAALNQVHAFGQDDVAIVVN